VEGHGHIDTTRLNAQAAALVLKRHAARVGPWRTTCDESELEETADSYNSQEDGEASTQKQRTHQLRQPGQGATFGSTRNHVLG
jgi:hypothetical protein